MEVDQLNKKEFYSGCGKQGHTVDVCRKKATAAATNSADKIPLCTICKRGRHEEKNCYSVVSKPGDRKPTAVAQSTAAPSIAAVSPKVSTPKPAEQAKELKQVT